MIVKKIVIYSVKLVNGNDISLNGRLWRSNVEIVMICVQVLILLSMLVVMIFFVLVKISFKFVMVNFWLIIIIIIQVGVRLNWIRIINVVDISSLFVSGFRNFLKFVMRFSFWV